MNARVSVSFDIEFNEIGNVTSALRPSMEQIVYFSSADRSNRDDKWFIVHRTSHVCCTHPVKVTLYSRSAWLLASCL